MNPVRNNILKGEGRISNGVKLFDTVAIVGTGLIGGSIALAAKKGKLCNKVIGVARSERTLRLAKKSGAIDEGSLDFAVIKDADLIILATPVGKILDLAPELSGIIKKGALVTDVGSTKLEIVSKLEKSFPLFLGSHPLAGMEKRGIKYSSPAMFEGSLCILTPTSNTKKDSLAKIRKFWQALGAKVVILSPQAHDKILSFVSHLPHAAAFSLVDAVPAQYLRFASSGLKDTTRIAGSDALLWTDIFLSNRRNLVEAIDAFIRRLSQLKNAISRKDRKSLLDILEKSKKKRETL